ncbi:MAG TPA: hypothetical protein VF407_20685, partial [Polyangiaceae bacterium]
MKRSYGLALGLGIMLIGCGGDDSSSGGGSSGKTLISSSSAPADATCPNGGTKLSVGNDTNGNGTLDPDEVTGTQEICNAATPTTAPATLTSVTPTGPDATCTNGGVMVKSGADTNGNGKLDDSEVTDTKEICTGGSSAVLSTTTAVGQGDLNCPLGGTETQSGPDNGNGGGVAGDGVLQTGEITSTTYACASLPGFFVGGFAPPPALSPQPAYTIDTHGGSSASGAGATGGGVTVNMQGTLGGHVRVFKTGKADAASTPPAFTPNYGTTKLDVTVDTALNFHSDGSSAADGEYYFTSSNLYLRQDSTHTAVPVTGLHVAAGKKFTLPVGNSSMFLQQDIVNEGTIVAPSTAGTSAALSFVSSGTIYGAATAKWQASGSPVTNAAGGNAGQVVLEANTIVNLGAIDSSGA